MLFNSTRDNKIQFNSSKAILKGISEDGGLFVPESFPEISECEIAQMVKMDYCQRAEFILSLFLTDFTKEQITSCVKGAYSPEKFTYNDIAHLNKA
ncbi:MAG: threonine synthase, partial [Clostridia bacterium]